MGNYTGLDRKELLILVSELYHEENMTQQEISEIVGKTRPTIAKLLKEALESGIVEIKINREFDFDQELGNKLAKIFDLVDAHILICHQNDPVRVKKYLGITGAKALTNLLKPGISIALTWGTTLKILVDAMEEIPLKDVKIIQLVGALGAYGQAYDSIALVQQLSEKLHGESFYLNAPFLVESSEVSKSLINNISNRNTIEMAKKCDIVLVGVGKIDPKMSTLYLGGHISLEDLNFLHKQNAIGDACGHPFGKNGCDVAKEFNDRIVSISNEDLKAIPTRLAIAGGKPKAAAILGALKSGFISQLVTDQETAKEILKLNQLD